MTWNQNLNRFWTQALGFEAVSAFTNTVTNRLCSVEEASYTHRLLPGVLNDRSRKRRPQTAVPYSVIPQEKLANTEIQCRKIIDEIPIATFRSVYYRSRLLKHLCIKWPCVQFVYFGSSKRKSARAKPLWTILSPLSGSKNARWAPR